MRVGVIGTGSMGQHHVRNYAGMEDVELVGIADLRREKVKKLAWKYGTTPYTDYRELLKLDLDAVSIAVPTTLHRKVALAAIDRGINVLVEKPIADTVRSARAIIERARKRDVKLMVGHVERFNPAVVALKENVDKKQLGDIVSMSTTRVGPFNPRIRDVGIIMDLGVHDIDVMSYLYSERVDRVYASAGRVIHKFEDYASILLSFNNGNAGLIKTNWLTPHKVRKLTVTGTQGIAYVDYIQPSLEIYNGEPGVSVEIEEKEPLRKELEHFLGCVEKDREPEVGGEEGLHALRVALAAIRSYKTGKVVRVDA